MPNKEANVRAASSSYLTFTMKKKIKILTRLFGEMTDTSALSEKKPLLTLLLHELFQTIVPRRGRPNQTNFAQQWKKIHAPKLGSIIVPRMF